MSPKIAEAKNRERERESPMVRSVNYNNSNVWNIRKGKVEEGGDLVWFFCLMFF